MKFGIRGRHVELTEAVFCIVRYPQRITLEANPATAHMFIVNPLTDGGLMNLFSTHPPMQERIRRLEQITEVRQ